MVIYRSMRIASGEIADDMDIICPCNYRMQILKSTEAAFVPYMWIVTGYQEESRMELFRSGAPGLLCERLSGRN